MLRMEPRVRRAAEKQETKNDVPFLQIFRLSGACGRCKPLCLAQLNNHRERKDRKANNLGKNGSAFER